jgi:hypothetical protein
VEIFDIYGRKHEGTNRRSERVQSHACMNFAEPQGESPKGNARKHERNSPSNFEGVDGEAGRGSLVLDISSLPAGIYILKITANENVYTHKIVKY